MDDKILDVYLKFYGYGREEIKMRHGFLDKTLSFTMAGVFTLAGFSLQNLKLLFLVPVFISFNFILYSYNLLSKSNYATYNRILEIAMRSEFPFIKIPLMESYIGTFSLQHDKSRNYHSIWALRSLMFPFLLVLSLVAYLYVGQTNVISLVAVSIFLAMDILAVINYMSGERANRRRIQVAAQQYSLTSERS